MNDGHGADLCAMGTNPFLRAAAKMGMSFVISRSALATQVPPSFQRTSIIESARNYLCSADLPAPKMRLRSAKSNAKS